ncbi:tyrosine--tRNA ligase [Candidatus Roizmanbacteria bacterium RIFCSPLOWO2_12_FULL_40_12]|uniref:tyrosine--tRNA ligase n=1 Tax=Candidatus Roizmanbacteria bacterium RIFCSPLOWO2_01_FULL_40_42 TaxID=1802066 RepID=A0A1F7J2A7_9BACT|nr:MAG: tyrosine--tRNA ligase [Candidatus Roizmanbacteria bacterium RIFCSPHIGHO2_02_FULL_40_53]OGK30134.1 MAG: tyrosine--tRNA ligase [Candidatus Roizmanbacteria bacterium RIFCSPHIGHO2_12_41_18]OGK36723.1 MAG: tyrosine--tRNA ligase [Candidatus Roizmanbacteria bacterium RIFCSPHIGHO2_12_FULL_40_130]OGK49739.1 MAG: tyrosine--tRNA ligase [Candidatus Roizmanbacteria bacterium RIFCSPLOWO2_01_FULL_40_42]OGK59776.1 MAG: tyrosine--tRNA ligase [Candidatus Roizmanbacteria bacterium RIFCSPLOWO2_02_FULL_40_1
MTTEEKIKLIKEVGEEIVTEKELKALLDSNEKLIAYDGFEPSGQMHIAQGILRAINVNKMTKAGVKFKMLVADWHALANKKMGGDLDNIQTVGKYFIEIWRSCGMDMENVEFIWASDLVKDADYWKLVLQIAGTNSINRFIRTAEIMGRGEKDELTAAQLIYPCMQAADIFTLGAKITQLGMDQRKVNVLAREIGNQLGFWKPVIVSHHMLAGLLKPSAETTDKVKRTIELKMSKSNPDSAIFMTDTKDDIERKLNKAWCPEGMTEENPVLEYVRYILFEVFDKFTVERNERFGGDITFDSYEDLEKAYKKKEIHPQDLKTSVTNKLNEILTPVREHFQKNPYAKNLLAQVQSFQVTR